MTTTTTISGWPERPATWPDVLVDTEVCQYIRLDLTHGTPASAKRSLRHIRKTRGLPCLGRIGGKVLFRKSAVDEWLQSQEQVANVDAA